ncbi:MAG TPA: D-alanine--D-alanine ligase A [Treponema sp.]|jgi:D-alanine-D-alanine ligase|nr:D-alanine--D-alanine ligase A [Treponema sp.]HBB42524.1 D-alanine--D-alanine ligase A [Treponema sp.]
MNVVLIYGGRSGEHEISLVSCSAVARNISEKHNVKLISIDKDGRWYAQKDSVLADLKSNPRAMLEINADEKMRVSVIPGGGKNGAFVADGNVIPSDVVFPVLHGTYGEDGTIQGLLEMANVPYVGCGVFASSATMDKVHTKILWEKAGLPVVPYICITRADVNDSKRYDSLVQKAIDTLHFPLFVKPCSAGSSDGASKATNERELSFALMDAFQWDNKVLIEKSIDAREVEFSVTGNSVTADSSKPVTMLRAYGPGEIVPKHMFYDYDAKYNDPDGAELKIPALLDDDKLNYLCEIAKKAYTAVDASGLSRVDFFIDRNNGEIYLNEINSIPGFTSISMFPKLCDSDGLHFTELIDYLFEEGIARFEAKEILKTSRQ